MNQQANQQTTKDIQNWEKELDEKGFINDDGPLLKAIRQETNSIILSKLLSFAALSRLWKNERDSLAEILLERHWNSILGIQKQKNIF